MDGNQISIVNARVLIEDRLEETDVTIRDGRICRIGGSVQGQIINAEGMILSPGLIDLHIHGISGYRALSGKSSRFTAMAAALAQFGVTSFLPTLEAASIDVMRAAAQLCGQWLNRETGGARILGCHMEGPFLNPDFAGAQDADALCLPTEKALSALLEGIQPIVRIVTLAPELIGAREAIEYLCRQGILVSMGHTGCSYEQTEMAVKWGVTQAAHLFNAMPAMHHRQVGCAGGILTLPVAAELIADGIHVSWPMVKIAVACKRRQLILISDSIEATGMADGGYYLGKEGIEVTDGIARSASGALAGSTLTLNRAVANMVKNCSVPIEQALYMATGIPAIQLGMEHSLGYIREGYQADLVLFDRDLRVKMVMIEGRIITNRMDQYAHKYDNH